MTAADMIVGKAGASSITEAFLLEKPFLVTTLIPGQETPNLRFIERHNLGWVCLHPDAQTELLAQLANNPDLIAEKISSIQTYKAWNIQANQTIEPLIEQLLTTKDHSAFAVEPVLTVTNRYA
jgi:UDP-N-acetylglucosamine:LPS N-acetylglucosamine transferase